METTSKHKHTNRLIDSTSPYLLQHAHNPVDWYPWGPEAIARARSEDKPIFLSVGYSACHWCHVMEREVFENPEIAAIMNQYFVNIKVDREERPDLDELYMLATQITTGSGGWPMSVWLTPDLEPFYAGTYFPPVDTQGRPGFPRLAITLAQMWEKERAKLLEQAQRVVAGIQRYAVEMAPAADGPMDLPGWLTAAMEEYADRYDPAFGGLGGAPKFPPSQALRLWLALLAPGQAPLRDLPSAPAVLREMTVKTLDGMMRGGLYDQVGGGFARYATDEAWQIPHFEKMLYDNAQLAAVYALAAVQLGRPDYARIARHTLDFWLREMAHDQGGFYAALDADSEGHEGKYYLWTVLEIRETLRHPDDSELLIKHFGLSETGNFEGGNILHVARGVEELAVDYHTTPGELQQRVDRLCGKLRATRAQRVAPARDDKILTGWNGLMISALAIGGRVLREPQYLEAAHRAIGFLLINHMEAGRRLLRTSREGRAHVPAFLEDHACLLNGLLDLIDSTAPHSLPGTMARKRALELADTMLKLFHDPAGHGFFFTHAGHEKLFARLKTGADNATPAAGAMAIRALLRLAAVSGKTQYRDVAMDAVAGFAGALARQPSMFGTLLLGLVEDAQFMAAQPHFGGVVPLAGMPLAAVTVATKDPGSAGAAAPVAAGLVTVDPVAPLVVTTGGSFSLSLTLHVAPGFHVPADKPRDREAFATLARLRSDLPLATQEWHYPLAQRWGTGPEAAEGFAGTFTITAHCTLAGSAPLGRHVIRVTVLTQACTATSCRPPEKLTVEVPVEVRAPTSQSG